MKDSAVLSKALKYMDGGKRWTKDTLKDSNGNVCALGALHVTLGLGNRHAEEYVAETSAGKVLTKTMAKITKHRYEEFIPSWNDDDETTWSDVEKVFKAAIKVAKNKEQRANKAVALAKQVQKKVADVKLPSMPKSQQASKVVKVGAKPQQAQRLS